MREREAAYQTQQRARILDEIVEAAAAGTLPCCAFSQPLPRFSLSPPDPPIVSLFLTSHLTLPFTVPLRVCCTWW